MTERMICSYCINQLMTARNRIHFVSPTLMEEFSQRGTHCMSVLVARYEALRENGFVEVAIDSYNVGIYAVTSIEGTALCAAHVPMFYDKKFEATKGGCRGSCKVHCVPYGR